MFRPKLVRWTCVALSALALTTCGELGKGAPPPTDIAITLTDTGCTADGVGALLPDQLKATLVNKTSAVMAFILWRLNDGHAYAELETAIQQNQQRIASNGPYALNGEYKPVMATSQTYTWVSPQQTLTWQAPLASGTYGLVCRRDSPTAEVAEAIYIVGPFRVP